MPRPQELAEMADADLIALHCAGDADAFGELFRRHRDRMWAVALRTTRDPEMAADAVQDGFLSAFRRAESFRGDSAVTTWLHRIVVNACLDRLRRVKPTSALPEHEMADRHDPQHGVEVRLDVQQALEQISAEQRLALTLVDLQELSVAEAGQVLGVPPGTIKSRCARGRKAMATLLTAAGSGPERDATTARRPDLPPGRAAGEPSGRP